MTPLPRWADLVLLPILNLLLALLLAAGVVLLAGASPWAAIVSMTRGAFGDADSIGYTLYYSTDMMFVGLAVAVAFHAGLFNIGAEGQAYMAGLGASLVCLYADTLPAVLLVPLAMLAACAFGAAWATIPGWLQATRGSHVVITTIMFNFISYALMTYLLAGPLIAPGSMSPESRGFGANTYLPALPGGPPLNAAFLVALASLVLVWLLLWHTRFGYALRVFGAAPRAATYAGIDAARITIATMVISGALAGGVAINEILGAAHKLQIGFTAGYGFTGIAVALMGRNHPLGILPAALLFGALYQGGAALAFDVPGISNDLVVAIQGLVILTTGGMPYLLRPLLARVVPT